MCFGNKRFIEYWCASCKTHFCIEKKDASLVLGDDARNQIDNAPDVKPTVAVCLRNRELEKRIVAWIIDSGYNALGQTWNFENAEADVIRSLHNIFRCTVLFTSPYAEFDLFAKFAQSLNKSVVYYHPGPNAELLACLENLPPPGVNLWHDQMLVDLVGLPPI